MFDRQVLGLIGIQAEAVCCPHPSIRECPPCRCRPAPDPPGPNPRPCRVRGSFVGGHGTKAHPAGTVTDHYDAATGVLTYSISYVGLSGPVITAHIHGPTSPMRQDAPVVQPIPGPYVSPMPGKVTLTPRRVKDLGEGELYVNLHTTSSPDGEARSKLMEMTK